MEPMSEAVGDEVGPTGPDPGGVPDDQTLVDGVLAAGDGGPEGDPEDDLFGPNMAFEGELPEAFVTADMLRELEEVGEIGLELDLDGEGQQEPVRFLLVIGDPDEMPSGPEEPDLEEGEPGPEAPAEGEGGELEGMVTDAEPTEVTPNTGI